MTHLVQQYFSSSARRNPNKAAINCGDVSISYETADAFSNSVAHELKANGVARGSFVPFFMDKSVNSVLSILSILKSDCAYVPIDAKSPSQRAIAILETISAPLLIVDKASRAVCEELIPADKRPPLFIIDEHEVGDTSEPVYENLSIDIAYVLFTSGSTGIPKGVMIPHKAIIDYIDWCVDEYEITENDVIANHAPLYFDNSTFDLYTAFKTGAELHLVDDAVNAVLPSLIKWIENRGITTFFCVPSVLAMLARSRRLKDDSFSQLRHLICAGEVLHPDVLRIWMEKYPHIQFTNMYGPTEITVDCSWHVIHEIPEPGCLAIPIGKSRRNMEMFVRTEGGELSKASGARGELLVRGTSVAYGYLGDEEKSRKAFIQNPLHSAYHDPLYCTGDLVEIGDDGDFLFLGRIDHQIKFLGHRIELGEIEAALVGLDDVDEGVAVFKDASVPEECEIGALVRTNAEIEVAELQELLKQHVPGYMVPTRLIITAEDFPQTPNGKYDRKTVKHRVFGG